MGTVTQYNLAHIQGALGGASPVSMSEYYRGGSYVPTTGTSTVSEGPFYTQYSYEWSATSVNVTIYWAGSLITAGSYGAVTSISYGSYVYIRSTYVSGSGTSFFPAKYYIIRQYNTSVSINTGVPSSGQIAISQLYGARNP